MAVDQATMLRFAHPEGGSRGSGMLVDVVGRLATVSGDDAIRQSLLMLISTRPGERVMRPNYGCPLHRLVFQPLDPTTRGLAMHYVEQAVRRWEPRVDVLEVNARAADATSARLLVTLNYRVKATHSLEVFDFELDLMGAA